MAIRTTTARDGLYVLDLVADLLGEDGVGQEDQPVVAGVWMMVLAREPVAWAEYARLDAVHSL